jgi:drug/metabolite transporter (DMT)-like permease
LLGLRWLAVRARIQAEHPVNAIVIGCVLASACGAFFAFPIEEMGATNWLIVSYLGLFQIALAYLLVADGIHQVSALQASLLLLVEPVCAPIWAWIFLAELAGPLALAGGAVVILATVAYTAYDRPAARSTIGPTGKEA